MKKSTLPSTGTFLVSFASPELAALYITTLLKDHPTECRCSPNAVLPRKTWSNFPIISLHVKRDWVSGCPTPNNVYIEWQGTLKESKHIQNLKELNDLLYPVPLPLPLALNNSHSASISADPNYILISGGTCHQKQNICLSFKEIERLFQYSQELQKALKE